MSGLVTDFIDSASLGDAPTLAQVQAQAKALGSKVAYLAGVRSSRKAAEASTRKEVTDLNEELLLLEKAQKVLMHLMDKMTKKDLSSMDDLVTYGLQTVFPDREVSMRSEMVDTGKKIYIDMRTLDGGAPVSKDQMGSASVVESFLLRVLCLLKTKGPKLMLLDETFGAVETDRVGHVGRLLDGLAKSLKLDMLLVTHQPGVADATMFRATLGEGKRLHLQQVGGHVAEAPESMPVEVVAPKKTKKAKAVRNDA